MLNNEFAQELTRDEEDLDLYEEEEAGSTSAEEVIRDSEVSSSLAPANRTVCVGLREVEILIQGASSVNGAFKKIYQRPSATFDAFKDTLTLFQLETGSSFVTRSSVMHADERVPTKVSKSVTNANKAIAGRTSQ